MSIKYLHGEHNVLTQGDKMCFYIECFLFVLFLRSVAMVYILMAFFIATEYRCISLIKITRGMLRLKEIFGTTQK